MPDEWCELTDLKKKHCAHCLGHISAEEEAEEEGQITGGIFGH